MSLIKANKAAVPPPGEYPGKLAQVKEQFGVVRQKFNGKPGETETLDTVQLEFDIYDPVAKKNVRVTTRPMRRSLHEKSSLHGKLRDWLGNVPSEGVDTDKLIGKDAMLKVENKPGTRNPSQIFADVVGIAPLPTGSGNTTAGSN